MLTLATLGMTGYALYALGTGLVDLFGFRRLEIWAALMTILLGGILLVAAAFVRVLVPGGLALAMGALLGLQALALHDAAHLYQRVEPVPQIVRGFFAALLVVLALLGARREAKSRGRPD